MAQDVVVQLHVVGERAFGVSRRRNDDPVALRSKATGLTPTRADWGGSGLCCQLVVTPAPGDTAAMTLSLAVAGAFLVGLCLANAVSVRRYSRRHIAGEIALCGRGLFFSRTPDGTWWRLRLRARRCSTKFPADWRDAPPDGGVREPRRPPGPGPLGAVVKLQPPGC